MDPGADGQGRQAEGADPLAKITAPEYREKALKLAGMNH